MRLVGATAPRRPQRVKMVDVYGIKKPRRPSRVGLPIVVVRRATSAACYSDELHTESLGEVSSSGSFGLEEQSLVLLGRECDSHLTTQWSTIAAGLILGQGVVDLLGRHDWLRYG
jgi:hypothetical protein